MEKSYFKKTIKNNSYVHATVPITPEPDLTLYDPNDWYDLKGNNTNRIHAYVDDKNDWFNLPLTEARKQKTHDDYQKWSRENFKYIKRKPDSGTKRDMKSFSLRKKLIQKQYDEWISNLHK